MEYGCIGEVLKHSFSAIIHPCLASYKYELKELKPHEVENFMKLKDFKAINVTIPYKKTVMPYLDFIDPKAQEIGAVNTIVNRDGKLYGYNTDFWGLSRLIEKTGLSLKDKKVLILGTGGTSKTAVAVAESMGAKEVLRVSRSGKDGAIDYNTAYNLHNDANIIINTTPSGMYPEIDGCPIDINRFESLEGVIDAVYNPLCSRLVLAAKEKGIKASGGLYMLIAQAAKAVEHFIGKSVEIQKIDNIYADLTKEKQNIVLVGMPSSGKSTVGSALAEALNKTFIDTDQKIKKIIGMEIGEFFKLKGEAEFRKIESEMAKEVSKLQNTVISTGGGMILNRENIRYLKLNGRVYFLDRPLNLLITTSDRPLSSNSADLEKRYNERYHLYTSLSDVHIDASGTVEENVNKICEDFLK